MAEVLAAQNANWMANEALQMLGGIGYTTKDDRERHFQDVRGGMVAVRPMIQREIYDEFSKR
jgi:alkylation response protein AidB-like acyl-CoA dehydrogenase